MHAGTGSGSVGKRKGASDAEPELREYLRDWEEGFMVRSVATLMAHSAESGQYALNELAPRVDALANGLEVGHIHAWLLPDGHWARKLGLDRDWRLGADNVLRPEESSPPGPKFKPPGNRAQRRANGWR